jgi:hypothetical protein
MLLSIKRNENSKSTYPRAFKDALPQQRESSLKQYGSMRRLMNSEYLSKASKAPEEWEESYPEEARSCRRVCFYTA